MELLLEMSTFYEMKIFFVNKELFQPEQYSETFLCKPAFCDKCAWHSMEINTHISVEFRIFISPPARLFSLKFPSIFVNNFSKKFWFNGLPSRSITDTSFFCCCQCFPLFCKHMSLLPEGTMQITNWPSELKGFDKCISFKTFGFDDKQSVCNPKPNLRQKHREHS